MSLIDYLGSSSVNTLWGSSGTSSSSADDVLQALAKGGSGVTASGVTISQDATVAAAAKDDKDKGADALATELRKTLDAQYAKSGKKEADLSELSPRALSTIILNQSGGFSAAEVYAAKKEMKTRDRDALLQVTSNGFNLASIQSYQQQMAAAKKSMSAEEQAVRAAGI